MPLIGYPIETDLASILNFLICKKCNKMTYRGICECETEEFDKRIRRFTANKT